MLGPNRVLIVAGTAVAFSLLGVFVGPRIASRQNRESGFVLEAHARQPVKHVVAEILAAAVSDPEAPSRLDSLRRWASLIDTAFIRQTFEQLNQIENAGVRMEACRALIENWIQRDITSVAEWFGEEGSHDSVIMRMEAQGPLLEAMDKWEPERAFRWMETALSQRGRDLLLDPFFRQWATDDPVTACGELHLRGDLHLLGEIARQWADTDLNTAINWVKSLPEGDLKSRVMVEVSYHWAESNPLEAAAYALQQDDAELVRAVSGKWAEKFPEDAAAWVDFSLRGDLRDRSLAHIAHIWSQNDPMAAAIYAASMPEGTAQDHAVLAVVSVWSYADPCKTADWVGRFPNGILREQAMRNLIVAWAGPKPDEAGEWLNSLPEGPATDVAVSEFSAVLVDDSPDLAFAWAGAISVEQLRNVRLEQAATLWLEKDNPAARAAISSSTLPENIKKQLLSARGG